MKLLSILVENYRSLKKTPSIRIENLSIFIGENNSGKSNLLNAIKIALQNGTVTDEDFFDKSKELVIEFEIGNLSDEMEFTDFIIESGNQKSLILKMIFNIEEIDGIANCSKTIKFQTKIPHDTFLKSVIEGNFNGRLIAGQVKDDGRFNELIEDRTNFLKDDALKVVRKYVQTKLEEHEYDLGYAKFTPLRRLYELMPKFLFIPAVKGIDEELKGGKNSTFNSILQDIFTLVSGDDTCNADMKADREKRDKIKGFCKTIEEYFNSPSSKMNIIKQLEEDLSTSLSEHICRTKVNFSFNTPSFEDVLKLPETSIDDGCKTTVERKGHGLQRALILAILKLYVRYMNKDQGVGNFFIGIEEPEIYLHPHSQRKMFDILKSLSSSNQIFITTHSAVLVNKMNNPENIIKISKASKESQVKQLKKGYFVAEDLFKIEKNLTVGNSEMFFSKTVLFVEGDTEKHSLPIFAKKLDVDFDEKGISTVSTGSGDNFEPFLRLVIQEGFDIPHLLMCDSDKLDVIISLLNKLNITRIEDYVGKSNTEKRTFLKTKNCYVLQDDFETTFAKNVDSEIILDCLSELKGKSITEEDIESLKGTPEKAKNNLKNRFNKLTKEMRIRVNYGEIEIKYKDLIEELYAKAESENQFEIDNYIFKELLADYMKKQNKPKLGKKLGEKLDGTLVPTQIKEIILKLNQ